MIYKTKKEEGKKHITMPLRSKFRLFQQVSRPISVCFGRFWLVSAVSVTGRYNPIWPIRPDMAESARFGVNRAASAQIEPSWRESGKKKKKKLRCGTDARSTASRRVRLGCTTLPAASMHSTIETKVSQSQE